MTNSFRASRVTMKDVAREAGVSIQTVSNYINGRLRHMRPDTERRVSEAITRLGFVPNRLAQGLRSTRARAIGLVINHSSRRFLGDPMTAMLLAGVGDQVREDGYGLFIQSVSDATPPSELRLRMAEGRFDGAIVFLQGASERRSSIAAHLKEIGLPSILLQEHGRAASHLPVVSAEDRAGAKELTAHLFSRGRQDVTFVTAREEWSAIEERIKGFREAHREGGIALSSGAVQRYGQFTHRDAYAACSRLLQQPNHPTAFICGNDLLALGAIRACRDAGLRVPQDVSVAGFDDFEFAEAIDPTLTTVRIDGYEMGRYAARSLIDAVQEGTAPLSRQFGVEVILRESTASSMK